MTMAVWGGVLGATAALGLLFSIARVVTLRRPLLEVRVLPYVRDLTTTYPAGVALANRGLRWPRSPVRSSGPQQTWSSGCSAGHRPYDAASPVPE